MSRARVWFNRFGYALGLFSLVTAVSVLVFFSLVFILSVVKLAWSIAP